MPTNFFKTAAKHKNSTRIYSRTRKKHCREGNNVKSTFKKHRRVDREYLIMMYISRSESTEM